MPTPGTCGSRLPDRQRVWGGKPLSRFGSYPPKAALSGVHQQDDHWEAAHAALCGTASPLHQMHVPARAAVRLP